MERLSHSVGLVAIFAVALGVSLLLFIAINRHEHHEITSTDQQICKATQIVAMNQQRVLRALIELEPNMIDKDLLRTTLHRVPVLICQ